MAMRKYRQFFWICFAVCSLLTGCGPQGFGDPDNKDDTFVVRSASDEVKLIHAGISNAKDPGTYRATTYPISTHGRVLLRLSSLKANRWDILAEQPILLKIEATNSAMAARLRAELQICPLQKNWMMLATWNQAHPYQGGGWSRPGGDYDSGDCLSPLPANAAVVASNEEKDFCSGSSRICIDLMPWFQLYVRERQTDFGLALTSSFADPGDPLVIRGDGTSAGPSIFWRRLR